MSTPKHTHFDYIIIGTGVAGFQLAMALQSDVFFKFKKIALIESTLKNTNDKTYCFWEKESGIWDSIVSDRWKSTKFYYDENELCKNLKPYVYKQIDSIDFYTYCKSKLSESIQFRFFQKKILSVTEENDVCVVETGNRKITADYTFDSRVSTDFFKKKDEYIYIPQTCFGWKIKTEQPIFDPDVFTMMDYRYQWKDSTTFTYILPKTTTEALVEFTVFASYRFTIEEFETHLRTYLNKFFPGVRYEIVSKEDGRVPIPMTNYPFEKTSTSKVIKIGTAGGWVKSTSGYSFKRTEKFVQAILNQLKTGKRPIGYKQPMRFRFYDQLLLQVLQYQNSEGSRIFFKMFSIPKLSLLFRFLDEETSPWEDIKLMIQLPFKPFIKAIFFLLYNFLTAHYSHRYLNIILLFATFLFLLVSLTGIDYTPGFQNIMLFVLFGIIGLPHGAMDHIIHQELREDEKEKRKRSSPYIIVALIEMFIYGLVWIFSPLTAFFIFILISAYHFGESQLYYCFDTKTSILSKILISAFWGLDVLGTLMVLHLSETQVILSSLFPDFTIDHSIYQFLNQNTIETLGVLLSFNIASLFYLNRIKKLMTKDFLLEILILGLLFFIFYLTPLYIGFLIYFGLWHSVKAIQQIFIFHRKKGIPFSIKKFYSATFGYTLVSVLGILMVFLANYYFQFLGDYVFLFFIMIGVLTLPHFHLFSKMYSTDKSGIQLNRKT